MSVFESVCFGTVWSDHILITILSSRLGGKKKLCFPAQPNWAELPQLLLDPEAGSLAESCCLEEKKKKVLPPPGEVHPA